MNQRDADILEDRFIDFAGRVITLTRKLPRDEAGKHVARQILRSGTSPAPNYGEARSSESDADFIHKLSIVLKELNETRIWLKIIIRGELMRESTLVSLIDENAQLAKIISTSIKTVRSRLKKSKK